MEYLAELLQAYPVAAPLIFIVARAIPVAVPPIPGIALDLAAIPIFGWVYGLFLAGWGVMLGSMVAFYLARYFREPLVARFTPLQKVNKWEEQFSERKKFWVLVLFRILTAPVFDYLAYAAGLSKMKASTFFWSTFVSGLLLGIPIFYFGGYSFAQGPIGYAVFIGVFVVLLIGMKLGQKRRADGHKA